MHAAVDRHVEPGSLTEGLAAHLGKRAVSVVEGSAVQALSRRGNSWAVETTNGEHLCDAVVVATGVAANDLLRPLGVRLPAPRGTR